MWTTFYGQYLIVLTALLISNYCSCCLNNIISIIGANLVLLPLSWYLAKWFHRYLNGNIVISSHKKAVLVTGCDSGFGNRIAYKLNENGFMVYATVLDTESDGSKHLRTNTVFPDNIKLIKLDITSDDEVKCVYDSVYEDLKQNGHQLWGLVNNAGIAVMGYIEWDSIESFHKIFDVNVFGMVRVTRAFLPLIRQSKGSYCAEKLFLLNALIFTSGRIVNMSSILGKISLPIVSAYCMTKSAVLSFSDALRRELTKWHVSVSVIFPGYFHTNMTRDGAHAQLKERAWDNTAQSVKQAYSEQYEQLEKTQLGKRCDDIDLVVNSVIDALRSNSPQLNYTVVPKCGKRLFMFLNDYLPHQLNDIVRPYL